MLFLTAIFPPLQCDRHQALEVFHSYLFDNQPLAALIGAGCPLASEAVAEVSQYYNLSLVGVVCAYTLAPTSQEAVVLA